MRRQLRSAHPVGSHLSGRLDSSAVAVLAARALAETGRRLPTYAQVPRRGYDGPVPRGRYADETALVEAIAAKAGNIDLNFVVSFEHDDFADLERLFLVFDGPVRNPTKLGWMLAIQRLAAKEGRRVLLGGQMGNFTISWSGWPQTLDNLRRGRLIKVRRQVSLFHRLSPNSRATAFRRVLIDPLLPAAVTRWSDRRRHPGRIAPWQDYSAIRPNYAARLQVDRRAAANGHDFRYRRRTGRGADLAGVDYAGDWRAGVKALTGVEPRDPTADLDVVRYCLGVPPEQFLAEGIDRSLIRRAMWARWRARVPPRRTSSPPRPPRRRTASLPPCRRDTTARSASAAFRCRPASASASPSPALLRDAPIILLDEATAALDAESERLFQLALDRLRAGRTMIVVAHRLSSVRAADRILVIECGRVVEAGSHDELLRRGGRYAALWAMQHGSGEPGLNPLLPAP